MSDMAFVIVCPYQHVMKFEQKDKLAPRFVRPFDILEHVGKVVYRLVLPVSIERIHNIFHVSLLHKYINNSSHVLRIKDVELEDSLVYKECLV